MRTRSILATLIALMMPAVGLALAPAAPASAAYTTYVRIHAPNASAGGPYVIDMRDYSQVEGGIAQLWALRTSGTVTNQRWTINRAGTTADSRGIYQFRNAYSGKCLHGNMLSSDTTVKQFNCNGTSGLQKWIATPKPAGWVTLANQYTGQCLDARGYGYGNGVVLQTYPCHGDWNQQFNIQP